MDTVTKCQKVIEIINKEGVRPTAALARIGLPAGTFYSAIHRGFPGSEKFKRNPTGVGRPRTRLNSPNDPKVRLPKKQVMAFPLSGGSVTFSSRELAIFVKELLNG